VYFFAIETTRRKFASTSAFLACGTCPSPRLILSSVRVSSSGACSSASVNDLRVIFSCLTRRRAAWRSSSLRLLGRHPYLQRRIVQVWDQGRPAESKGCCSKMTRPSGSSRVVRWYRGLSGLPSW
jgi:hypothetical protein